VLKLESGVTIRKIKEPIAKMNQTENIPLLCAAGTVVITPPLGTSLCGYFTDRKAEGVLDDLYASILVIQRGAARVVWVACDLIEVPADFAGPIRQAIAGKLGILTCAVILSATHTHTGPVMSGPLSDAAYLQKIRDQIIQAALTTAQRLEPASLEFGKGLESSFAFNRRYFMKNGAVVTNPGAHNPDVLRPADEVDHSLQVIKVTAAGGRTLALVVNLALHPDTTDGNLISSDWPGILRSTLQALTGQQAPVLVLNGAAGDVNHFDVLHNHVAKSSAEARRIGEGYARSVLEILRQMQPLAVDAISAAGETVSVPYRRIWADELAEAQRTVAELSNDPEAVLQGSLDAQDIIRGSKAVQLMFARDIVQAARELQGKTLALEVTVVRLGPLVLTGINGEVFSGIGLMIKGSSPFKHTLIVELTNGSIGYLGTRESYEQGGYETMLGSRVCDEIEEYILRSATELMEQLKDEDMDGAEEDGLAF
jgi:neutral ceramidase